MKHSYLYKILSLCLAATFFLGGCAQDLQTPATAENDTEVLSETAPSSSSPTPAVSPEADALDVPEKLPKPEGNTQESEEARCALYERAEPLYQNDFSYFDRKGYSYTFADIGAQYPVMLVAEETFTYEIAEPIQAFTS